MQLEIIYGIKSTIVSKIELNECICDDNYIQRNKYGHPWERIRNLENPYCYVKNANNKWYHFNDTSVSEVNENNIITNKGYCYFYKKIKK